jgi:hypothetical protein
VRVAWGQKLPEQVAVATVRLRQLSEGTAYEPAKIDAEALAFELVAPVADGLAGLQGDDVARRRGCVVDVGGTVVEVVGEQDP